jgi:hypothetical protein
MCADAAWKSSAESPVYKEFTVCLLEGAIDMLSELIDALDGFLGDNRSVPYAPKDRLRLRFNGSFAFGRLKILGFSVYDAPTSPVPDDFT